MSDNKKSITYQLNFDISDPLRKQIEWVREAINKSHNGKIKSFSKGEIILARYYDKRLCKFNECYCVALTDSDNNSDLLVICPIALEHCLKHKNDGLLIGKIPVIVSNEEFYALISQITRIKKSSVLKLNEIGFSNKLVFIEANKTDLILNLYKDFLSKLTCNRIMANPVSLC